ncbi:MAG: hypothetical protein QG620_97 [Patescibacteria group bacterium]|nr:hypothetical protein [Patescibacteria group bacterium]
MFDKYKNLIFPLAAIALAVLIILISRVFSPSKEELASFSFSGSGDSESYIIEESNPMKNSNDSSWWLNSGGVMPVEKDYFSTNLGELSEDDKWRKIYKKNNSRDTDKGYHPQNIFRLVTKSRWQNLQQQVYFNIEKTNLSESEYRNESNGVLLFNRYQDGDNLYYTGLRVDGHAVIKKKIDGKYYTMAEKKVLTNDDKYDRVDSSNLIPENEWIGIKSELENDDDTVNIKLYIDIDGTGEWKKALEVSDDGKKYGGAAILEEGYAGIRTDFMDVKFRGYEIRNMK